MELGNLLRDLKERKITTPELHRKLYPTVYQPPHFYSLPKEHKNNTPFVSSIGTITYECAKYLADVLSPLMGKTEHHMKNSKEFAECVKLLKVGPEEELRSYNVLVLFTSVPVDKALEIIWRRLQECITLSNRTPLSPDDVIAKLDKCKKGTYFLCQGNTTSRSMALLWVHKSHQWCVTYIWRTSNRKRWLRQLIPLTRGKDTLTIHIWF